MMTELHKAVTEMLDAGVEQGRAGFWKHAAAVREALEADKKASEALVGFILHNKGPLLGGLSQKGREEFTKLLGAYRFKEGEQ